MKQDYSELLLLLLLVVYLSGCGTDHRNNAWDYTFKIGQKEFSGTMKLSKK